MKSRKIKEKDKKIDPWEEEIKSKQFRIKRKTRRKSFGDKIGRRIKEGGGEKKKEREVGNKGGRKERERVPGESVKKWKEWKEERENEGRREITLSPTLTRGSYESRGGRNPDYCSPDYNITRTDRSTHITGDSLEIAPGIRSKRKKENNKEGKDAKERIDLDC